MIFQNVIILLQSCSSGRQRLPCSGILVIFSTNRDGLTYHIQCTLIVVLSGWTFQQPHSCTFSFFIILNFLHYILLLFQQGEIKMDVMFVAPDEDSDDDNNEYEDEHGFRSAVLPYLFPLLRSYYTFYTWHFYSAFFFKHRQHTHTHACMYIHRARVVEGMAEEISELCTIM